MPEMRPDLSAAPASPATAARLPAVPTRSPATAPGRVRLDPHPPGQPRDRLRTAPHSPHGGRPAAIAAPGRAVRQRLRASESTTASTPTIRSTRTAIELTAHAHAASITANTNPAAQSAHPTAVSAMNGSGGTRRAPAAATRTSARAAATGRSAAHGFRAARATPTSGRSPLERPGPVAADHSRHGMRGPPAPSRQRSPTASSAAGCIDHSSGRPCYSVPTCISCGTADTPAPRGLEGSRPSGGRDAHPSPGGARAPCRQTRRRSLRAARCSAGGRVSSDALMNFERASTSPGFMETR